MNRKQARELINSEIKRTTGGFPTIDDLADSVILCDALDEMETLPEEDCAEIALETAMEMLEEEGFDFV